MTDHPSPTNPEDPGWTHPIITWTPHGWLYRYRGHGPSTYHDTWWDAFQAAIGAGGPLPDRFTRDPCPRCGCRAYKLIGRYFTFTQHAAGRQDHPEGRYVRCTACRWSYAMIGKRALPLPGQPRDPDPP